MSLSQACKVSLSQAFCCIHAPESLTGAVPMVLLGISSAPMAVLPCLQSSVEKWRESLKARRGTLAHFVIASL